MKHQFSFFVFPFLIPPFHQLFFQIIVLTSHLRDNKYNLEQDSEANQIFFKSFLKEKTIQMSCTQIVFNIILLISVMAPALDNLYSSFLDAICNTVAIINPPAPESLKFMLKRLGLSNSFIAITIYVQNQLVDPFQRLPVL